MIQAVRASLTYWDHGREVRACHEVSLSLEGKKFVGILGPSGSGKSSLLYLLSGLKKPTSGEIFLDSKSLDSYSEPQRAQLRLKEFGFLFQQPYLLGYLSVVENVLIGGGNGADAFEAQERLARLGLADKMHRFPHELSGGERQRACVARALMGSPKVIFADEPTAALDHANGTQVVDLLDEHRGQGMLVMVTHDRSMLDRADRILEMAEGQVVG